MIALEQVALSAGAFRIADLSFTIPQGAYGVLMGRTGCGKTTILEAVCGLKSCDAGRIRLGERDVTHVKSAERGIGYVPQDGALFSTMTVRQHLAFALQLRKWSKPAIDARVDALADLLGIGALLPRRPQGLSGGEAQRVALGRALSFEPRVLCLDEPLSALDHDTRLEMCDLLESVKQHTGVTVLHVTHDRNEASRLADLLLRIDAGRIERVGTSPKEATP